MWGNQKKTRIEKIYDDLKFYSGYPDRKDAMRFIKQGAIDGLYPYFSDDLLADILIFIINNNLKFKSAIDDANKLFEVIVFNKDDVEQKNIFLKLFYQYELNDKTPRNFQYFSFIYSLFENKKLLLNLYSKLSVYNEENYYVVMLIFDYIEEARKYYVDETAFYSSIMKLINRIEEAAFNKDRVEELIIDTLKVDKKIAGVYDIDENELKSLPTKMNDALNSYQFVKNKQIELDQKLKETEDYICSVVKVIDKKQEKSEIKYKETLEELKKMSNDFKDMLANYKGTINTQDSNIEVSSSKLDILIDQLIKFNGNNILDKQSIDESIEKTDLKRETEECGSTDKPIKYQILEVSDDADLLSKNKIKSNEILTSRIYSLIGKINEGLKISDPYLSDTELVNQEFIKYIKSYYDCDKLENIDNLINNDSTIDYLRKYYYALCNDSLDVFKFFNTKYDINKYGIWVYNRKLIDQFDKDEYLNILNNDINFLHAAVLNKDIETLKVIIAKNPNFKLNYKYSMLKQLISECFDIDLIASNNPNFDKSIKLLIGYEGSIQLSYLKMIYDINPNFRLHQLNIITNHYIDKVKSLFEIDEIAYFTETQQSIIIDLLFYSHMSRDDVRKIIFSNTEAEFGRNIIELLENKRFGLSLDKFLKLDRKSSMLLYNYYTSYLNEDSLFKKADQSKTLKKAIGCINNESWFDREI